MKPRLRWNPRVRGWLCFDGHATVCGFTPRGAFQAWQALVEAELHPGRVYTTRLIEAMQLAASHPGVLRYESTPR